MTTKDDDVIYRGLYADARDDATTWHMFALLILLGAALAAFNLVTRMVDAQRRELGVGMALGVSPRLLAVRPLLVDVQIAVAGAVLGVGIGWLMALAMRGEMTKLLPLPIWLTPFQTGQSGSRLAAESARVRRGQPGCWVNAGRAVSARSRRRR